MQAGTVQRSNQPKQQGVSYSRRTCRNIGLYKGKNNINHTYTSIPSYFAPAKPAQFWSNPTPWSAIPDLVRHWSTKPITASRTPNGVCWLWAPTDRRDTVFTWRPVICDGGLPGVWEKNIWPLVYTKTDDKLSRSYSDGKKNNIFARFE